MHILTSFLKSNLLLKYALICSLLLNMSHAQNSLKFEHLTTENGLSQNDVNTIFQDSQGFMWFGTHDGLNRYNGYEFTVFNPNLSNPNTINSNLIWDIAEDKNSNLWIATTGSGLNYFDRNTETFKHFRNNKNDEKSLINDFINAIYIDDENLLWIGTPKGIDMLNLNKPLDSIEFVHYKIEIKSQNTDTTIYSFYKDSNHQLWICTSKGLFKISKNKNGDVSFDWMNKAFGLGSSYQSVNAITEDLFGNLIIGAFTGLFKQIKSDGYNSFLKIDNNRYLKIITDNNDIWASNHTGLFHFLNNSENTKLKLINHYTSNPINATNGLNKNDIKTIFIDNSGIIWIGTLGGGVNKLNPEKKQFKHIKKTIEKSSLSDDKVRSIFEDSNGTLWIGTQSGSLNMLSKNNDDGVYNKFKHFESFKNVFVIREYTDQKKLLFGGIGPKRLSELDISNPKSIDQLKSKDFKIRKKNSIAASVFSILIDTHKNIWIGTYSQGLHRWIYDVKTDDYKKDILSQNNNIPNSISNNIIRYIFEDSKGNIWFSTGNGLCVLSPDEIPKKNPKFQVFKNIPEDPSSISFNYVLTIFESSSGTIWIGTLGGGLNKYIPGHEDKQPFFKRYTQKEGLPNNAIKGILEDDKNNLWISTNKGLSKFNPDTEIFKNYNIDDGLQSNEFSELACFKKKSGELMFGGVNGFNVFYPDAIKDNITKAETVFTGFSVFNKPIAVNEEINGHKILDKSINTTKYIALKHNQNSFSFDFASLHYVAPSKNKYAYKLDGFDTDWIYTTSKKRFANYTNLEPGNYILKVKSSNNDGVWDETPAEINIDITPPFWDTTLAKIFYGLLLTSLLFAFRRFTVISTSKKHNLELEHLEKERFEEINRLKLEFFTNISHEFRTPLTLIKGPLEYLQKKWGATMPKEIKEQYDLMQKNTDYLLRLVNQLLDFRKMNHGKMKLLVSESNIVAFLKEVGEPYQFLGRKKNIHFTISASKNPISTWFDPDAVEKIANNLLSNAFKFTPIDGKISLEIIEGTNYKANDSSHPDIDPSNFIVIQVKDTGPGIPQHRIKHIFERFYTEIDRKGLNPKGTGIGLSFVKNLVELHRGYIDVISNPETGTTFNVWLPKNKEAYENHIDIGFHEVSDNNIVVSQIEAQSHAIATVDDIVDENISRSRSKLPVLLMVDDNPDIRQFVKRGLGEQYYIYEAENGQKGLELAKKVLPNIVITDLMMPIMDGVTLCNKLKSAQETSHIPVVILTAKMSQEWEIEGLKTGADAYIRKPFDLEVLELKLSNILKYRDEMRKRFNREITLQPNELTVTSADETFLKEAIAIVEKHMMDTEFSVEMLVKEMHISRSNLYIKTKELAGLSCSEFIRSIRLKRAIQLLEQSDLTVKEIMYMTGFNTASYFSKCFKKQFGVIPSKYIRETKQDNNINIENS
jgi:signal transduction histidine kinase/ligand-binding sensor domain-containing protein/DNA-binding response OmpR family regulator